MRLLSINVILKFFFILLLSVIPLRIYALDLFTKPVGLYHSSTPGENWFPSIEDAIALFNQVERQKYNDCVAGVGPGSGGFCAYNVVKQPEVRMSYPPQGPLRDGVYQSTYFRADRVYSTPDQRNNEQTNINWTYISFSHNWYCPDGFTLDYQYRAPDYSVMTGAYCVKKISLLGSPPESCPLQFGNPIDAATSEKREHEIDYSTADGLLRLERFYVSQYQGWQFGVPSELIDFSPSNSQPKPVSCYLGTYKLNTESRAYCFEYTQNPVTAQQQVVIKTATNNFHTFNKNANGSLTGTDIYTGKLTQLPDNSWVHAKRDNSLDFYSDQGLLVKRKLATGREIYYRYTGSKLSAIADDSGREITLEYDGTNRISGALLPDGNSIHYNYDSYNNITQVTFPDATSKQYLYNESAMVRVDSGVTSLYLTGKINERGIRNGTYRYENRYQNFSISTEQADGVNKYGRYIRTGISDEIRTPLGSILNAGFLQRNGMLFLYYLSQPAGSGCNASVQYIDYDADGLVRQKKEFNGRVTQIGYSSNRLENVRVEGLYTSAAYLTNAGASLPYLSPNTTLPAGIRKISTEWHPEFRVKTRIAEAKKITTNIYNNQPDPFNANQILSCAPSSAPLLCKKVVQATTDVNGASGFNATLDTSLTARVWQYTYNEFGKPLTITTPQSALNNTIEISYEYYSDDSSDWRKGDLKQITNAAGHSTQYTRYDANGRVLEMRDANNVQMQFTYDLRGRLLTASHGSAVTQYTYDPVGNLIRVTQPDGVYIEYDYDNASRLFRIRDAQSNTIEYTLDKASNITNIRMSDSGGALRYQQQRVYDALSRVQNIINASNNSTTLKYDASGNLTSEVDANNKTTSQTYDALNQFKQRTDALAGKINYTYDAQGNLTSVKDQRNNATSYRYNAFDEITEFNSPDTGKTTFVYDAAGKRISSTDARNITQIYTYDLLNRLTGIQYPDSSENMSYVYDGNGLAANDASYAIGKLTSLVSASMRWDFIYNEDDRLAKKRVQLSTINSTTEYEYDDAGRVAQIIYPSGRLVNYDYNSLGQVSAIYTRANSNEPDEILVSGINYLPFGPAQSFTYGNGLAHTQNYDLNYRLTSIQVNGILHRDYVYDAVSNITNITNNVDNTQTQTLNYDALNRLTSALGGYGNLIYTYDAVGNRLTESRDAVVDTYSYATTSNRLNSIARSNGNRSFTYDAAGNPTQRTSDDNKSHSNSFNNANRLSSVNVDGSLAATYTYNALGQRVIKTFANGTQELYFYDEAGQLISVTDGNGTVQRDYIYWGNQLIGFVANGNIYYTHVDHLNTPQVVTNQNQQVVWMGNYEPFGKLAQNQSNSIEIFSRFPGQYYDGETGLYQNYFRDYDPSIGRYIESDPIGILRDYSDPVLQLSIEMGIISSEEYLGLNHLYGYANQNPMNMFDIDGLNPRGGERGATGGSSGKGTDNPYKHCRQHPTDPNKIECKHHQTGKWIPKPKPADWDKYKNEMCTGGDTCQQVAEVVVVGGVAYITYRCIRMLPSLFPPLWPTLPANLALP